MKTKIFYLLFIVFLFGCEKKNELFPLANQEILFQVDYENYAWGHSHSGIVIDSSGNVRYFNLPKNWHYPDTKNYISESDMQENILQLDTVFYTIEKNILLKYFSMLKAASEGQLSKPVNIGADMGETSYSGFLYDSATHSYKNVLIKMHGDWSRDNNAPGAKEIYNWLMTIYYDVLLKLRNNN